MAANVERAAGAARRLRVDVGVKDTLLPVQRTGGDRAASGFDHDGIAVVDPFVRA